ncbi:MAG: hypothetical protein P4K93_00260 [Terracidiphilus sp.]|nr:hypothetical protein [Terracidiphilus sp.]MDR3796550.1 hypothetical protein [Terracidiphilus sp.]
MSRRTRMRPSLYAATLLTAFLISACHSYHIDATIENHTGAPIQLLEVDYPTATFGADSLAADASFHYRFQVRGSGQLKVSYTTANGQTIQISGPTLAEHQQGNLEIVLEPAGKAEFHPQLTPPV